MLYIMSTKPTQHTHCPVQATLLLQYSTDNNLHVQYTLTSSHILGSALDPKSNWTISESPFSEAI